MGAIKSKVFGETQFEEDYSDQSKIDNDEAFIHEVSIHCKEPSNNQNFKSNQTFSSSLSTLSGTSSFQDINDSNNLTVRNDNTINNNNNNNTNEQFNAANKVILITSENNTNSNKKHNSNNNNNSGNNKTSSHHFPLLDLAKLESKHQQKIRPYTLFEQNSTKKQIHNTSSKSQPNTAVSTNSFQLQQKQQQQQQQSQTQANKENQQVKMETVPSVTSFQPPNHLQKSQYFRSFRMASRRLFSPNVKKLNNGLEISNENNKSLFKSSEQLSTLKPQPKPRVSVESILQTSNSTFENNHNNHNNNNNYFTSASSAKNNMNKINPATINTNTSTTAPATQSNLIHNDTDRIETNVVNLDINIKLDKFETQINDNISNVINTSASTNHLDINNHSSLSQKQTLPRQPPPLPLPPKNLKSKSTVDFSQPKYQSSSIQTSATSTKLVDTVSTNYNNNNSNNNNSNIKNNTGANIQNKSFRNLNFNHSGYFSSIKKRFTPQSNVKDTSSTETVNTLKNSAKEPTIEPEMITMFDPRKYRSTSIVESLSGKLGDHITGSSSNTANIVRSEVSVPILSYSSMANNQNIRSASVSEMPKTHLRSSNRESVTSSNTDWDALNENQNKNENLINDLKKQIDSLNKQLEHLGREDSKIINELSEKIENLAKMNVNIITAIGTQQENKFRASFFGRPRQQSQTSEAYYARLKQQNDILLLQQRQIEQLRKDLLSSFVSSQQTPTPQPTISQNTSFVYPDAGYYANQSYSGYSRPTMSNTYSAYPNSPYPNSNYYFSSTPTAPTPTINPNPNMTSPTFSTAGPYHGHPGHSYQGQNAPYYMNRNSTPYTDPQQQQQQQHHHHQQQQQQQQYFYYPNTHPFHQRSMNSTPNGSIFYDPNSGQYFQYRPAANMNQQQYFYNNPNLNGIYANLYAYRKSQASAQTLNENNTSFDTSYESNVKASSSESEPANVIITEVSDDDEDIDLSAKFNTKKDYVDAISLNDEEI